MTRTYKGIRYRVSNKKCKKFYHKAVRLRAHKINYF